MKLLKHKKNKDTAFIILEKKKNGKTKVKFYNISNIKHGDVFPIHCDTVILLDSPENYEEIEI